MRKSGNGYKHPFQYLKVDVVAQGGHAPQLCELTHLRLRFLQPEPRTHPAVHLRELLLRLLALTRVPVKLTEARW